MRGDLRRRETFVNACRLHRGSRQKSAIVNVNAYKSPLLWANNRRMEDIKCWKVFTKKVTYLQGLVPGSPTSVVHLQIWHPQLQHLVWNLSVCLYKMHLVLCISEMSKAKYQRKVVKTLLNIVLSCCLAHIVYPCPSESHQQWRNYIIAPGSVNNPDE